MTCFEHLSIDLLTKIFDYLSFTELVQAFFGLQKHLDDVIQDYSVHIDFSQIINDHIHRHASFQCRSLLLSGLDRLSFQSKCSYLNFKALRVVTFRKMNLLTLHSFIEILPMRQLESITIRRLTWHYYPIDFYEQIWMKIMDSIRENHLHYLYLPYHIRYWNNRNFSIDFLVLKQAILEYISVNHMLSFINHTPNLRRFKACLTSPHRDLFRSTIVLSKLNHLTLNLHDQWSLEEIEQLFSVCPYLKCLILKLEIREEMKTMFEPSTWQRLIEEKLSHLIYLRLQLNCIVTSADHYQKSFNQDIYWLQRQPHFQVTIYKIQRNCLCH